MTSSQTTEESSSGKRPVTCPPKLNHARIHGDPFVCKTTSSVTKRQTIAGNNSHGDDSTSSAKPKRIVARYGRSIRSSRPSTLELGTAFGSDIATSAPPPPGLAIRNLQFPHVIDRIERAGSPRPRGQLRP